MFTVDYILAHNNNVIVQHYWPLIANVQISNAFTTIEEVPSKEYIVAIWRIKLKHTSPVVDESGNLLITL